MPFLKQYAMGDYDRILLDELFFEADNLIKEKRFTEAIQKLEAILTDAPDYGKAYNHLGWIYETQYRDYSKSEELYRRCIALTPEYTPVYGNLSITLSTVNKLDEQEQKKQREQYQIFNSSHIVLTYSFFVPVNIKRLQPK